LIDNNSPYS